MPEDRIYSTPQKTVAPFEFNEKVVEVFDDMLERSVPFYRECLRRQAQLAEHFYTEGTRIYDLGCSNGNLGLRLCGLLAETPFEMVAVDSSQPMLDTFAARLSGREAADRVRMVCSDIRDVPMEKASVVVLNLTLQFLPPAERDALIARIHQALVPGGVVLLTEKVLQPDPQLDALQQEFYYRFKQENGYSQLEISQKREALENVLVPEPVEGHLQRLRGAGFTSIDVWFKWFNFASLLAVKDA